MQVENVLFRLPKPPFEQSAFFSNVFKQRKETEAASERYYLKDVTPAEFRDFLRARTALSSQVSAISHGHCVPSDSVLQSC